MSQDATVAAVVEIVMPRLSDSMEDGKILAWLKQPGELVVAGDELAEIETDKATVVYEADGEGVLEIVAPEGTTAAIGTLIGRLHPDRAGTPAGDAGASSAAAPPVAVEPEYAAERPARVELSSTQSLIARRMAESRATVPDFSLEIDIDMTSSLALRSELKRRLDPAPTVNDIIVKACAVALGEFPLANASFKDDRFELHPQVNVGVAVATEDSLVVPTVFDADKLTLAEIALVTRELATKVRTGRIAPAELAGATFTVSNLGMYGIRTFSAIINRPQSAILAAGAVQSRAVARGGVVETCDVMTATLSCDHRILYGAYAARFLARIRDVLEQAQEVMGTDHASQGSN